jgi:DNA-binding MarR family transcriptional regulator
MKNNNLEIIVDNLFSLFPLFHKKLLHPSDCFIKKDISPSHFHILVMLSETDKMSVSEIGKKLSISKPNMTPLIDKLVEERMVERLPDSKDRRIINIAITSKGVEYIDTTKAQISSNLESKLMSLSADELEELSCSLKIMNNILSKIDSKEAYNER